MCCNSCAGEADGYWQGGAPELPALPVAPVLEEDPHTWKDAALWMGFGALLVMALYNADAK